MKGGKLVNTDLPIKSEVMEEEEGYTVHFLNVFVLQRKGVYPNYYEGNRPI